jgi:hypothetical protein
MKPRFIVIVCAACSLLKNTPAFSQEKNWQIGFLTGTGIVSTRTPNISFTGASPGIDVGVMLQCRLTKILKLRMDILAQRRIYRQEVKLTDQMGNHVGNFVFTSNSDFIEFPLMLSWNFGTDTKFVLNTGTYFNYLRQVSSPAQGFSGPSKANLDNTKRAGSGVLIGIGISQPVSKKISLLFEIRNKFGLVNYGNSTSKTYRNDHSLLVGFSFAIGKTK